jgi:hypothetical protein
MWLEQLVQLVGLDIFAVGLLVVFGAYIIHAITPPPDRGLFSPLREAAKKFHDQLAEQPAKRAAVDAGILLVAALGGTILNLVADRILDSDFVRIARVPVPVIETKNGDIETTWLPEWDPEDGIKLRAFMDVRKILIMRGHTDEDKPKYVVGSSDSNVDQVATGRPKAPKSVGDEAPQIAAGIAGTAGTEKTIVFEDNHCSEFPGLGHAYKDSERQAKEVFQRAYLVTLGMSDQKDRGGKIATMLAREELFVKLFRVSLAVTVIVALVALMKSYRTRAGLFTTIAFVLFSLTWTLAYDAFRPAGILTGGALPSSRQLILLALPLMAV